ncbi:MAG TPA: LacI family DNA-binding transcriptional regulator [Gaiellaceae bacterium]|nr:LacI family DNA-binding transcriptional regulator [Gaiellaceae bacterium]
MSVEPRRPTLIDVARLAQVAPSTASRALKESPRISEATRLRVRVAARGLGYQPNRVAQSLRAKTAPFVGIVVPDIGITFYSRVVKGAQEVLEAAGYQALVMNTEREAGHEEAALRTLEGHQVSGVLLATSRPTSAEPHIPTVYFDSLAVGRGMAQIALANDQGMELLVRHLAEHGHTRIAYIGGPPIFTSGEERLTGFRAAAERHGVRRDAAYVEIADSSWSADSAAAAMARLLALAEAPTAVVASGDTLAMGAIAACRATGRRVPEDIALVAFDDPLFGSLVDPPMTALRRSDYELGREAAQLLLDGLDGEITTPAVRLPVELVVRRSCGCGS